MNQNSEKCMRCREAGMKKCRKKFVFWRILVWTFCAAPVGVSVVLLAGILHSVFLVLQTVCMQAFFERVSAAGLPALTAARHPAGSTPDGWLSFGNGGVLECMLVLAGVIAAGLIFGTIHNAVVEGVSFRVSKEFSRRLQKQTARFPAEAFEDTSFLERHENAKRGVDQSVFFMNVCFLIATYYVPYFVLMGIYLAMLKPVFLAALLLIFLPVLIQQRYRSRSFAKFEQETVRDRRMFEYYEGCMTKLEFFKETRLLGAYRFFEGLFLEALERYDRKEWRVQVRSGIRQMLIKCLTLAGYLAVLLLFVWEVWNGGVSVGAFAALFTSLNTMFRIMEELVCGHVGRISENYASIRNYTAFLDLEPVNGTITEIGEGNPEIRAEHLDFRYPGCEAEVLKDVSFTVHSGETVAVVGENGAGKSTLLKVLCGQYLPTGGCLRINGKCTRELEWEAFEESLSGVFQNYVRYGMTLFENVAVSESRRLDGEAFAALESRRLDGEAITALESRRLDGEAFAVSGSRRLNEEVSAASGSRRMGKACEEETYGDTVEKILKKCGFPVERMPEGLSTMLSREFGGIDLSGGQWQKAAIARGCFRERGVLILDEPTAAIDPLEERHMDRLFEEICRDRTAVIITHRLAAARAADRILVMENGRLAEQGTHDELLQAKGAYWRMYELQKQNYTASV